LAVFQVNNFSTFQPFQSLKAKPLEKFASKKFFKIAGAPPHQTGKKKAISEQLVIFS
jgi:hypothetical protein